MNVFRLPSQRRKEWWVLVAGTETAVELRGPHFLRAVKTILVEK